MPVYELALQEIKQHIATEKVLDLYAGVGTIGLSVARDCKLTLVEYDKPAFLEMERNCQGTGTHPVLAKSEEALKYIAPDQTVIVDPPRRMSAGIARKAPRRATRSRHLSILQPQPPESATSKILEPVYEIAKNRPV